MMRHNASKFPRGLLANSSSFTQPDSRDAQRNSNKGNMERRKCFIFWHELAWTFWSHRAAKYAYRCGILFYLRVLADTPLGIQCGELPAKEGYPRSGNAVKKAYFQYRSAQYYGRNYTNRFILLILNSSLSIEVKRKLRNWSTPRKWHR